MKRKKKIKVQGVRGKRFTSFPFFANEAVKKEVLLSLSEGRKKASPGKKYIVIKMKKDGGAAGEAGRGGT